LSAKKRIRQNAVRRSRNRARKRLLKIDVRTFTEAVSEGDSAKAADALKVAAKRISQVAAKGTIHKNAASRRISRMQRKLNALADTG
jgi:small subunit ribosomal protein S20